MGFMILVATMVSVYNLKAVADSKQVTAGTTPERCLKTTGHLLSPLTCVANHETYKKTRGVWLAVLFIRDLALSFLSLNIVSDPLTLLLMAVAVQLCYIGYIGVFRYHNNVLEHIGLLIIDGLFLVMLALKAVTLSTRVTAAARLETISPILICVMTAMFLIVIVLAGLTFFVNKNQPRSACISKPVGLPQTTIEAEDLVEKKQADERLQLEPARSLNEIPVNQPVDLDYSEPQIPEESPAIDESIQNNTISEVFLEVPCEKIPNEPLF